MELNDNLNKENFFNEMNEKYPKAMKIFCKWIDDYKIEIHWNKLFKDEVKFHDIPAIFQIPIIHDFLNQNKAWCNYLSVKDMLVKWLSEKDFQNL